jgi:transcription elongation factor greA
MSKNFLTREGYDKLIAELQELKQDKLPAVLERLAEAKAMGDLSENFEYKSAMEDKDFINSRIAEITNLIADVEIVEKDKDVSKVGKVVDF